MIIFKIIVLILIIAYSISKLFIGPAYHAIFGRDKIVKYYDNMISKCLEDKSANRKDIIYKIAGWMMISGEILSIILITLAIFL